MKAVSIGVMFLSLVSCGWAQDHTTTISVDKTPALELAVPADAKVTPEKDKTVIQTTNMFLYVWSVAGAKTLDDAQLRLADTIKGDVLKFAATATNVITVCGAPARHLSGGCVEADDGDPATADIVIFAAGGRVFVACVHGEHNDASREREPMLKVLRTAKAPSALPVGN